MNNDLFPETSAGEAPQVYKVSELTRGVRAVLEEAFDRIWVEGEISNLRVAASKHAYFVLKDEKSQIRCVLFRNYRAGQKFQLADGDHVVLNGRLTVYDARGEYQIIVETVEPVGLGALQKAICPAPPVPVPGQSAVWHGSAAPRTGSRSRFRPEPHRFLPRP